MTPVLAETEKDRDLVPKRKSRRGRAIIRCLALCAIIGLGWYLHSAAFQNLVRNRIIAQLELATGGKAEIQSLQWSLFPMQFAASGVTIHGHEPPDQSPFFRADRILAQAKITSLFGRGIGLRSLVIDRPVLHWIVYPDGATNQPLPKVQRGDTSAMQGLFALAVDRIEVHGAELLLNERTIPFEFSGTHLSGSMNYATSDQGYDGEFSIELSAAHYQNMESPRGILGLHFLMRPAQFEIKTLKFTSEHSELQAAGEITNYQNPEIRVQGNAAVDLSEAAQIFHLKQLRAGRMKLSGSANFQSHRYEAQGSVTVQDMTWREAAWNLAGVDGTSAFLWSSDTISLPSVQVKTLGGSAQGSLRISNWNAPSGSKNELEHGSLHLRASGLQVSQVATSISTRRLPLGRVSLAGSISGEVNSDWTGPARQAVTRMKLEVNPPATPTPKQIPLTANVDATYHHAAEALDLAGLSLATRAIRLNATGELGSAAGQLKVAFNANDLRELQPILATLTADAQVPVEVHGRASFNGTVSGKFTAVSARGRMDLEDFDTLLGPIHSLLAEKAPERIHWDSTVADVVVTPSGVSAQNGLLKRRATQLAFSGSASLNQWQFDPQTSDIAVNLQMQNAKLESLRILAGFNYPVTGMFDVNLRATGTLSDLRGNGSLAASNLTLYGEPFTRLRSNIIFSGQEAQFNDILLSHNGAQLTGSTAVSMKNNAFRFDLTGTNIELANFSRFIPTRFALTGNAGFHVWGSGTPGAPSINGQLSIRKLLVNGEAAGDVTASAETKGEDMALRAGASFQNAILKLDGSVHLRNDFPVQMTFSFDQVDFDPLIRAYLKSITGHAFMQGEIEVLGPLKTPRDLSMAANIHQLSATLENIKVQNDGPLRFSVNHQSVHVDQFHLTGEATDISLRGDANLTGSQILDVHADGKVDLKILHALDPNVTSSGAATLAAHLAGTVRQPEIRGRVEIANGAISAVDLPNGLSQINGRLVFAEERLQIENVRAHTGGGDLDLSGFVTYRNGLYFDVTATSSDVRVRYPPGLSTSGNATLRYTGSAQASLLSGNATIIRLAVDPHLDLAQYLARANTPVRGGVQNPFLDNLRLDVHVVSTPELRLETSQAKVAGDVDLHIRGTAATPSLLGRVNIVEGNASFNGAKYRLELGDITFSNPQVIQPTINVEMTGRVRDYDITIGFHGPVDRLNITYRSDPPLSSSDIIALLAFGRTKQEDVYSNPYNNQPGTTTLTTSDTMLQQALTSASTSRVQKLFGVGSVKIDPQVVGPENNLGPRLTIEQQIQNNVTVTYITNVAQSSAEQVIQVEYNLTKSVSVVAVRDQNGIVSFEVRVKQRKR